MNSYITLLLAAIFVLLPNPSFGNAKDDSRVSLEFFTHSEGDVNFPVMKSPQDFWRHTEMFLAQQDVESFNWLNTLVRDKIYNPQNLDAISAVVAKVKWVILRDIYLSLVGKNNYSDGESSFDFAGFTDLADYYDVVDPALLSVYSEYLRGEFGELGFMVESRMEDSGFTGSRHFFAISNYEVCPDAYCDPDTKVDIELEITSGQSTTVSWNTPTIAILAVDIQVDIRKFNIEHAGLKMHLTPAVSAIRSRGWKITLPQNIPKSELTDGVENGYRVIFEEGSVNLNLVTYINNDDYSLKMLHYGSYDFNHTNLDTFVSTPIADETADITFATSVALEQADLITEIELKNIPEEFVDREAAFAMDAITVRDTKTAGVFPLTDGFVFMLLISLLNIFGFRWRPSAL